MQVAPLAIKHIFDKDIGRPRWRLELIRCRAGESADFEVEACDAKGRLALPSNLVRIGAEGNWTPCCQLKRRLNLLVKGTRVTTLRGNLAGVVDHLTGAAEKSKPERDQRAT